MMTDEWIPYLLNRIGIKKDSLTESIIMLLLLIVMVILCFYVFIENFEDYK